MIGLRPFSVAKMERKLMRVVAEISDHEEYVRAMICEESGNGTYLFLYTTQFDAASAVDYWFETLRDACKEAATEYGITPEAWTKIDDQLPHCQQDWVNPAKIPGRETGNPDWSRLQLLIEGVWQEVDMSKPTTIEIPK
jgi:biofilm protein TabA